MIQKKLRIFAGPNGSGKSTLKEKIIENIVNLGIYVNADEIKKIIEKDHLLDFSSFKISLDKDNFMALYIVPI